MSTEEIVEANGGIIDDLDRPLLAPCDDSEDENEQDEIIYAQMRKQTKKKPAKQTSLSTVFSIWNTMIGSTLVTLPYGFTNSGLILGVGVVILLGCICCYTCNLVVTHGKNFSDYGDLVQYHFGRQAKLISMAFSLFVLLGACIAYHILMQECIYKIVCAIASWLSCHQFLINYWSPKCAALIILILYPITNLKNVSYLVSLNSFGVPFVLYSMYFIVYHGVSALSSHKPLDYVIISGDFGSFGKLGGIVFLSFFIHNAIQPIIRNSKPATQNRDVGIAYFLVGISYIIVGALGYIGFADSSGFEQNFFDAYPIKNLFAFSARLSLLFQIATVYPLVLHILRSQFFGLVFKTEWPNLLCTMVLNFVVMAITTCFACFYPNVGDVLRFTGAFGGIILIFLLPIGVHLLVLKRKKLLTWQSIFYHGVLLIIGGVFLALQFV